MITTGALEASRELEHEPVPDTIVFCESIEHIPEREFEIVHSHFILPCLEATSGRLVITNWITKHPIRADGGGWDHVRAVNDDFYDELVKTARSVIFREGSHLVLQF